jgi:hypothetical protein
MFNVGHQNTKDRKASLTDGNDDLFDGEMFADGACVQRGGTSYDHQGEFPGFMPLAHQDQPEAFRVLVAPVFHPKRRAPHRFVPRMQK